MAIRTSLALLCFLGLSSVSLGAPPVCLDTETRDACQFRTANAAVQAAAQEIADDTKPDVTAQNTGDADASATNDFLPWLKLLLSGDGLEDGQKIGFEWSDPFGFGSKVPNKLTVTAAEAEIHEPLRKALLAASLDDQVTALQDRIDAGDEVKVGYSLAYASRNYGRDPELQKELFAAILQSVRDSIPKPAELRTAEDAIGAFLLANVDIDPDRTRFMDVHEPARRAEYRRLAEAEIPLKNAWLKAVAKSLQGLGFEGLVRLIDNQPQLTLTLDYTARDEAVGPDAVTATFAWEGGGRNVRSFRKYAADSCSQRVAGDPLKSEVNCLATYLAEPETARDTLRFRLAAAYSEIQRYVFELPDPAFSFQEARVKRLEFSATVSRQLGPAQGKAPRPRIDFKASYEDFSDDPARQDRGLVTATFTQPVSKGLFIALGAVYATRPEYRGEVDSEVSARLGFTYKFIEEK